MSLLFQKHTLGLQNIAECLNCLTGPKGRLLLTGPKGCGKYACLLTTLAVLLDDNADVVYITSDVLRFLHRSIVQRYINGLVERGRTKLSSETISVINLDKITASYDNYVDFLCEYLQNSRKPYLLLDFQRLLNEADHLLIIDLLCQLAINVQGTGPTSIKVLIALSSGMGGELKSNEWEMLQRVKLSTEVVCMKGFNEAEAAAYLKHSNISFKLQDIQFFTGYNPLLLCQGEKIDKIRDLKQECSKQLKNNICSSQIMPKLYLSGFSNAQWYFYIAQNNIPLENSEINNLTQYLCT